MSPHDIEVVFIGEDYFITLVHAPFCAGYHLYEIIEGEGTNVTGKKIGGEYTWFASKEEAHKKWSDLHGG